jgi:hypothetical protein
MMRLGFGQGFEEAQQNEPAPGLCCGCVTEQKGDIDLSRDELAWQVAQVSSGMSR